MLALSYLVKRNMRLYWRNKTTVFFSLLSMLIIVALYALFMADVNVNSLAKETGNREVAKWLINNWIMGGIITVNAVNITIVVLINMVEDRSSNRLKDFLIAPLKRWQIIAGYVVASIIVGIGMSFISLIVANLYIVANGGEWFNLIDYLKISLGIVATVISIAGLFLFILLFVNSEKTASTITTVVGTLIGFIAGVYVPIGAMPDVVQNVMKLIPVTYSATLFKEIFVAKPASMLFKNEQALDTFNDFMGNRIIINDYTVTYPMYLVVLLISGVLFFGFAVIKIKLSNK